VEVWDSLDINSSRTRKAYTPLKTSDRDFNICVSFPHMKDTYWLSVDFGISQEIIRLGCTLQLYQAGGYENLDRQIEQIRHCVNKGADGVIIGSISYDGLNDLIASLKKKNIPVVDVINGISSKEVSAKSLVSFKEMGFKAGHYLVSRHDKNEPDTVKVAWFPGPRGAGWVSQGDKGFREAVADSNLEIVAVQYGDTGLAVQSALVEEIVDRYGAELDYIIGTGVTAEAAVKILRKRKLNKQIKIISYYMTPGVYQNILRGNILASPTDSSVIQGRIAVDQLVRILNNKPYYKRVGPIIYNIDRENIHNFSRTTMLAPYGFQTIYTVNRELKLQ
jgi:protein TorT